MTDFTFLGGLCSFKLYNWLIRCDHGDISRQAHPIGAQMYVTSPYFQLSSAHFKHARKARRKKPKNSDVFERWQIILCSCRS